jgi:hypothetical protein
VTRERRRCPWRGEGAEGPGDVELQSGTAAASASASKDDARERGEGGRRPGSNLVCGDIKIWHGGCSGSEGRTGY